ncbi:MAG: nucleotidyl transferase AbiEii/AbiGii toxin family protein [Acidobacteria bacterium]|nr:nucleotidyl transferase AbiEii/AbiGii toxin family protein [Acidobacteriota bacterium]
MDIFSPVHVVEQFHLLFLAQLGRRLDKTLYVVKGGCNLRFFHRSVRLSEDLDLDVAGIGRHALQEKIRLLLRSAPFTQVLRARGITVERISEPKQTDTTQRWKVGLGWGSGHSPIPTKIEFSRRGLDDDVGFGSVDAQLIHAYQLPPFMASHYRADAALRQKIGALANRRELQARDVFDVHHLIAGGAGARGLHGVDPQDVERARANALAIDFATFTGQVLAFLTPDDQAHYHSTAVWDTLVLEVVEFLQRTGR